MQHLGRGGPILSGQALARARNVPALADRLPVRERGFQARHPPAHGLAAPCPDIERGGPSRQYIPAETQAAERMGEQRHERDRRHLRQHRFEDEAQQRAGRPAPERQAGGIIDLDAPALQLDGDAFGEATIRRDQSRMGARTFQRLAQGDRDDQRLLALVGGLDDAQALETFGRRRVRNAGTDIGPEFGDRGRQHRLAQQRSARTASSIGLRELAHVVADRFERIHQMVQGRLRVGGGRLPDDRIPGVPIQPEIDARQDDGAVREACNGGQQPRGRGNCTGRARGDDRPRRAAADEPVALGREHAVTEGGGIAGAALGQDFGPGLAQNGEEAGIELPDPVEAGGVERGQPLDRDTLRLHLVEQGSEVAGEPIGFRQRRRHQSGLARIEPEMVAIGGAAPGIDEARQQHAAFERRDRSDPLLRPGAGADQRRLGLVDIAERDDARQEQGFAAELSREDRGEGAGGAARRQIERGARHRGGIGRVMDRPEPAIQHRLRQHLQKGRTGRDAEQVELRHRPAGRRRRRPRPARSPPAGRHAASDPGGHGRRDARAR